MNRLISMSDMEMREALAELAVEIFERQEEVERMRKELAGLVRERARLSDALRRNGSSD